MIECISNRSWKRNGFAFISGALGALALPPFGFLPAYVVALCPLVWLLDATLIAYSLSLRQKLFRVFCLGWFWGLGHFLAGLWWLGSAFFMEAEIFAWIMPFAISSFCAFLALFPALGLILAWCLWSRGVARIFAFAFGLSVSEWLRGTILTGFPWNLPGMVLGQHVPLMQIAAIGGLSFMTFLVLLLFAMPATLISPKELKTSAFLKFLPSLAACLAFAALAGFGFLRVPTEALSSIENVRLRIMQPNLQQDEKFNGENAAAILDFYLRLSLKGETKLPPEITHIIWPETALPFVLDWEPIAVDKIADILPKESVLVTGSARVLPSLLGEAAGTYYNSIAVVNSERVVSWEYDKAHLVPFGEYVPAFFEDIIAFLSLRKFVDIPGNYNPAKFRRSMVLPQIGNVAGTICYEAIFSSAVLPHDTKKIPNSSSPRLILNVTNDGWFGNTPGPYQHFAQSRLRAVEEGIPLVRVANTGISAVVDPYGRIIATAPLGVEAVFDSVVPEALSQKTVFSFIREWLFFFCLLASFLISWGIPALKKRYALET